MSLDDWIKQQVEWGRVLPFEFKSLDGDRLELYPLDQVTEAPSDCTFVRSMGNGKEYALRIVGE